MSDESEATVELEPVPVPPPTAAPHPNLADGVPRRLAPQFVRFERISGGIFTLVVSFGLFVAAVIAWLNTGFRLSLAVLFLSAWAIVTGFLGWIAFAWPRRSYAHASYVVDADGIEIRTGVWWRSVVNVPRSRVQHIDVSQGPLERSHGLGRLIIYTAGTEHSRVELPGLDHGTALLLRDHLLPRGSDDAV